MEKLQGQKQELLGCASVGEQGVASLKERVWELESNALEQEKVQSQQENTIKQLEQVKRPSLSREMLCPGLGPPTECPQENNRFLGTCPAMVLEAVRRHMCSNRKKI